MPVHIQRRTARRLAAHVEAAVIVGTLRARMQSDRLRADPQAAHVARQGAAIGETVALTLLDAGRWIGESLDRLTARRPCP
ncbi:MAG: hypothetical protein WAP03_23910 [Methylorubrum rhodinum]|uniref:hypothetical protein n=1 Tax=Methylorubrum rhodinum TaxID=29428 RepID=UPI001056AEC6